MFFFFLDPQKKKKKKQIQENLFATSGAQETMEAIRDDLDTGLPFENLIEPVHAMSECLIRFLDALPDPVIPFVQYQRCLDCCNNYVLCKQVSYALFSDI